MSEELTTSTTQRQDSTQSGSISLPDLNLSIGDLGGGIMTGETPSKTCRRCHRALKDAANIKRGYGPVCWAKVRQEDEKEEQHPEPCSITYPGLARYTQKKLWERVLQSERKTCSCGEPLKNGELRSYDHDGGWHLKGYSKPQWPYVRCPKCGYELSVWKLRIDISDLEILGKERAARQTVLQGV